MFVASVEDRLDEVLEIVLLLEDLGLLPEATCARFLIVVRLFDLDSLERRLTLEDLGPLPG